MTTDTSSLLFNFFIVVLPLVIGFLFHFYHFASIHKTMVHVHVADTKDRVGKLSGAFVAEASAKAIAANGKFILAISGGSLPKLLASGIVDNKSVEFSKWHVFFADERIVPLDHEDSNYLGCSEKLFSKVNIPRDQIHTVDATLSPDECAAQYEAALLKVTGSEKPVFDLILLGMGPDGHTASLFPGHKLLNENEKWVASIIDSPKPPPKRITLTLPTIRLANQIAFVAAGDGKAETIEMVLLAATVNLSYEKENNILEYKSTVGNDDTPLLPSSIVQKEAQEVHWFIDKGAAANILKKCKL
jgi:6-phosphogluconolactonase